MRRSAVVTLVTAVAATAPARAETVEEQRRELVLAAGDADARATRATGFAQLAAGTRDRTMDGEVAVGGEVRVAGERCDAVRAGGQARLGVSDGARASAEQWASACGNVDAMMFELAHHLEWNVRPSLLARLRLRPGENRRETVSGRFGGARLLADELDDPTGGRMDLLAARMDVSWLWSPDAPLAVAPYLEAAMLRYTRPQRTAWGEERDYTVDLFGVGGGFIVDDGFQVNAWVLRIANLRLGSMYLTGGIGIAEAGTGKYLPSHELEVQEMRSRVELAVEGGDARLHGHARFTRGVDLVPDGLVVVDNRLAAGAAHDLARTRFAVEAAVAVTDVRAVGRAAGVAYTGGGALAVIHRLGPQLQASARVDAARSFYAVEAGMDALAPRWAVQAIATLQATAGR